VSYRTLVSGLVRFGPSLEPAREPYRAGSARLGTLASPGIRLDSGSFRVSSLSEPSLNEPELAHESRAFFPALTTYYCARRYSRGGTVPDNTEISVSHGKSKRTGKLTRFFFLFLVGVSWDVL
jgi:hypothetical protein